MCLSNLASQKSGASSRLRKIEGNCFRHWGSLFTEGFWKINSNSPNDISKYSRKFLLQIFEKYLYYREI